MTEDYQPNAFAPDPERDAEYYEKLKAQAAANATCSFCGAGVSERFQLVSGLVSYICDECVAGATMSPAREGIHCSFGAETGVPMMHAEGAHICQSCVELCSAIIAEKRATFAGGRNDD